MIVVSQSVPGSGGMNQEAIGKLLDTSTPTFFREVFQNSNDQRNTPEGQLEFSVRVDRAAAGLVSLVTQLPNHLPISSSQVGSTLSSFGADDGVLIVSDRGTRGLSGSIDPGEVGPESRFARFFYNFGREQDDSKDGGAFGFGRGVLFLMSACSTIFVHSRFQTSSGYEVRLMGMTADRSFAHSGRKFTGRHWWCKTVDERSEINQPFRGEEANNLASNLGFTPFNKDETGTSIMVIAPKSEDLSSLAQTIQTCALVHAWPHFCSELRPRTNFEFESFGKVLETPDVKSPDSPLAPFVASYLEAYTDHPQKASITVSGIAKALEPLFGDRGDPNKELGVLSWQHLPSQQADPMRLDEFWECGWPKTSSIALMREPRIIVKYLEVPNPSSNLTTAGCFLVSDSWEQVFRASENITHDDWNPLKLGLPKGSPNPVLQCLTKIQQHFSPQRAGGGLSGTGSAILGDDLASMFMGSGFGGLKLPDGGGGGGGGGGTGGKKPRFKLIDQRLVSRDKSKWCTVRQQFSYPAICREDEIQVLVNVITSEGRNEEAPPEGVRQPTVKVIDIQANPDSGTSFIDVEVEFDSSSRVETRIMNRDSGE